VVAAQDARVIRRFLIGALVFIALQLTWQALNETPIAQAVVHDAVVVPASRLVNTLTPKVHSRAVDSKLMAPGGGLNIVNGCEGTEALFLVLAAFLVAPGPWRSRVMGFFLGLAVVFVVNELRILVLFYAYRYDHALFNPMHAIVTPIAVVLAIGFYFYVWIRKAA
jgi:exosortase family protein XrtM